MIQLGVILLVAALTLAYAANRLQRAAGTPNRILAELDTPRPPAPRGTVSSRPSNGGPTAPRAALR